MKEVCCFNTRVIYQDLMWLGLSYRQFDALVFMLGADYGQYFFGYSYDTSVSEISGYNPINVFFL